MIERDKLPSVSIGHLLYIRASFHQHMKEREREGHADSLSSPSLAPIVGVFIYVFMYVCVYFCPHGASEKDFRIVNNPDLGLYLNFSPISLNNFTLPKNSTDSTFRLGLELKRYASKQYLSNTSLLLPVSPPDQCQLAAPSRLIEPLHSLERSVRSITKQLGRHAKSH